MGPSFSRGTADLACKTPAVGCDRTTRRSLTAPIDDLSIVIEHGVTDENCARPDASAIWVGNLRRIGARKLTAYGFSDLVDDAQLLISELVTNGFQHSSGPTLSFHLTIDVDLIVIEVDDGSTHRPEVREADPDEESGRGMFLVDALADFWGVSEDGTTTWCALARPGPTLSSRPPACRGQAEKPP